MNFEVKDRGHTMQKLDFGDLVEASLSICLVK